MGKNSKRRREEKKRRAANRAKLKRSSTSRKTRVDSPLVITQLESTLSHLTDNQRKLHLNEVVKKSKENIPSLIKQIQSVLRTHDPLTLLAIISCNGLIVGMGSNGVVSRESNSRINQAHVEILQALALNIPEGQLGEELVTPDIVQKVCNLLMELNRSFLYSQMNPDLVGASKGDQAIARVQDFIRSNTQSVRNWGYLSQVKKIPEEIYSHFNQPCKEKYGFTPTDAILIFEFIISSIEDRISAKFNELKELKAIKKKDELLLKFHQLIGQDTDESDSYDRNIDIDKISLKSLFFMVMSYYELSMVECFYFEPQEISSSLNISESTIKNVLKYFSRKPGELEGHKKGFFFLDNPIWNKPAIDINGKYFCPLAPVFFSFVIQIFDEMIEKLNKNGLHKRRSEYLERKIDDIVKKRFPEALTVSGLDWSLNGNTYETDLITFIDSHAIIIEAKSHKISQPALRGASERIRRHLNDIFIHPSTQSLRLYKRLEELRLNPDIEDSLREKLPVALTSIHKIFRVSVLLENFAFLQTNLHLFKDTGWVSNEFSPCPSICLSDFEILFDLLEKPLQILHYLQRRTEMEGRIKFFGDELDLMGLYIETLFNPGEMPNGDQMIVTSEMSKPLDKYYTSKDKGILIEKPQPKLSKMFMEITDKLEERSTPRWSEIGTILYRLSPVDQQRLEKLVKDQKKVVNCTYKIEEHKNIALYTPPKSSEFSVAYILFKNENASRRDEFIEKAARMGIEPEHVKYCLVIAKNIDKDDQPYEFIALFE